MCRNILTIRNKTDKLDIKNACSVLLYPWRGLDNE